MVNKRQIIVGVYHDIVNHFVVVSNFLSFFTIFFRWAPLDISLQKLCNENIDGQLVLTCWHFSNTGNHTLVGEAKLPLNLLLKR